MSKKGKPGTPGEEKAVLCGAKTRKGTTCQNAAGFKTDHPGQGKCWLHGGKTPIKHGRYSSITRPRIKELLEQFESDPDPLDLLPEVKLLRALVLDFVERYDEMTDALTRWNRLFDRNYVMRTEVFEKERADFLSDLDDPFAKTVIRYLFTPTYPQAKEVFGWLWENGYINGKEHEVGEELIFPIDPLEVTPSRPDKIIDILSVGTFISQIGRLAESIQKSKDKQTFSMSTINTLYEVMGADVLAAVREVLGDSEQGEKILDTVERRWANIQLSELASRRPQKTEGES